MVVDAFNIQEKKRCRRTKGEIEEGIDKGEGSQGYAADVGQTGAKDKYSTSHLVPPI